MISSKKKIFRLQVGSCSFDFLFAFKRSFSSFFFYFPFWCSRLLSKEQAVTEVPLEHANWRRKSTCFFLNNYELIKLVHQNPLLLAISAKTACVRAGLWEKLLSPGLCWGVARFWKPCRTPYCLMYKSGACSQAPCGSWIYSMRPFLSSSYLSHAPAPHQHHYFGLLFFPHPLKNPLAPACGLCQPWPTQSCAHFAHRAALWRTWDEWGRPLKRQS